MLESTNDYRKASHDFMGKAWDYLAAADNPQASEKGWGAAAQMVKAVAEERGWPHRSHRLLYDIVEDLVDETGAENLSRWFQAASVLHTNFYENALRPRTVRRNLREVQQLLAELEPLLETHQT